LLLGDRAMVRRHAYLRSAQAARRSARCARCRC
jgi:hypothetical protein